MNLFNRENSVIVAGVLTVALAVVVSTFSGCTGQMPGSFRFAQQEETFQSTLEINTKIDLLWVVDNSSSMDVSQDKLRKGFAGFAQKYLQPTWDVRVAVITTDTYLANPAFQTYLNTTIPGSTTWVSPYLKSKSVVTNPLYNKALEKFPDGVKYAQLTGVWSSNFAQLLPGLHDGPIAGLCFEGLPYFLKGVTHCDVRDRVGANTGVESCINPGGSESAISECVNTLENNTVHSGKAIISTAPPAGVLGDATLTAQWTQQLIRDFTVNVTTGSVGMGSERGFSSVLQVLSDNETQPSSFFRAGSLRGLIFVSDEDDQSMTIPSSPAAGFNPWTGYTSSCAPKTVEGLTYTISSCPVAANLISVDSVKLELDGFFARLDQSAGLDGTQPNYFVASIVPISASSISQLQASRDLDDLAAGVTTKTVAVDQGTRYLELADEVGNGSLQMDIGSSDYSPILDQLGKSIVEKKGTFQLVRAPSSQEEMTVTVVHADGSTFEIKAYNYEIEDKVLRVVDLNTVLSFKSTDRIVINYQPKTLY